MTNDPTFAVVPTSDGRTQFYVHAPAAHDTVFMHMLAGAVSTRAHCTLDDARALRDAIDRVLAAHTAINATAKQLAEVA